MTMREELGIGLFSVKGGRKVFARHHGSERYGSVRNALAQTQNVRCNSIGLGSEHVSGLGDSRDDLIKNKEYIPPGTDVS